MVQAPVQALAQQPQQETGGSRWLACMAWAFRRTGRQGWGKGLLPSLMQLRTSWLCSGAQPQGLLQRGLPLREARQAGEVGGPAAMASRHMMPRTAGSLHQPL